MKETRRGRGQRDEGRGRKRRDGKRKGKVKRGKEWRDEKTGGKECPVVDLSIGVYMHQCVDINVSCCQ